VESRFATQAESIRLFANYGIALRPARFNGHLRGLLLAEFSRFDATRLRAGMIRCEMMFAKRKLRGDIINFNSRIGHRDAFGAKLNRGITGRRTTDVANENDQNLRSNVFARMRDANCSVRVHS